MSQPPVLDYSQPPLTRLQRKALLGYATFHRKPPTLTHLLRRSWYSHALLLAAGIGGSVGLFAVGASNDWLLLVVGLMAGAFFRDIGYFRVTIRVWPILDRVVDWKRVHELVGAPDAPRE